MIMEYGNYKLWIFLEKELCFIYVNIGFGMEKVFNKCLWFELGYDDWRLMRNKIKYFWNNEVFRKNRIIDYWRSWKGIYNIVI